VSEGNGLGRDVFGVAILAGSGHGSLLISWLAFKDRRRTETAKTRFC